MRLRSRTIGQVCVTALLAACGGFLVVGIRAWSEPDYGRLAQRPGVTALQKAVYHRLGGLLADAHRRLPSVPLNLAADTDLDAIPPLVEALADDRAVAADTRRLNDVRRVTMREIVASLIERTAQHEFTIGDGSQYGGLHQLNEFPDRTAALQKIVLAWYASNRGRSIRLRKLDDLTDPFFHNRMTAMWWIGANRERGGVRLITDRAHAIHAQMQTRRDSLLLSELVECGLPLGQIGDRESLPCVRMICSVITQEVLAAYPPRDVNRSSCYSEQLRDLFRPFHGLALLGRKTEALRQLQRIYGICAPRMHRSTRQHFDRYLFEARHW